MKLVLHHCSAGTHHVHAPVGASYAVQPANARDALGLHNASRARTKLRLISAIQEGVPQRDNYRICQAARVTEMGSER